jgi:hypothetical protein
MLPLLRAIAYSLQTNARWHTAAAVQHACVCLLPPLAASLQEFELPGIGSIAGFSGDRKSSEFFFSFTSETRGTR